MRAHRGSRGRPLAARLLLVAASTALVLAAVEVGMRLAGVDLATDPILRFHPTLGWTADPGAPRSEQVNRHGFRHQVTVANPEDRPRVVILGDSFSFGGVYPFARTFAGLLEQWLAADEPWDVVNLAASGYGTGQQLLALRRYGLDFQPTAVVLQMFPFNDLCNNNIRQAFTCSFLDFHRPYFVLEGDELRSTHVHPRRAHLRRWSRLFGLLELRRQWGFPESWIDLPQDRESRSGVQLGEAHAAGLAFESNLYSLVSEADQPEAIRAGWQVTERLVSELAGILAAREVPLIGVVIPRIETFRPDWPSLRPAGHPPLVADHGTARAEAMLEAAGARVISMRRRIIAGTEPASSYFYTYGRKADRHINARGHHAVAGWIVEELNSLALTAADAPAYGGSRCERDLRAFGARVLALPAPAFAVPRQPHRRALADLAALAADSMMTCRTDLAIEHLARLSALVADNGASYLAATSAERQEMERRAHELIAVLRGGGCPECAEG